MAADDLSPEDERQFQLFMAFDPSVRQWRNAFINRFGEPPNTDDDPTFDYRKAWQAGEAPQPYRPDQGFPHWGSAGKKPGHPTEWMNDFMQQFGVDPMTLRPDQVTPQMQQFMQQQLQGVPMNAIPSRAFETGGPVEPPRTADPSKREYEDYLLRHAVTRGEGQQFEDDVRRGPPYTSYGFAIGENEGRVERPVPRFQDGGHVGDWGFQPRIQGFQTGGQAYGQTMQPFGYDPTAYVTAATNWANQWLGNSNQQYQWAQDQFNNNNATASTVINSALNNAGLFDDAAAAGLSRYENMYAPAMQQQLAYAQNYASPANLALFRGQAMAGVGQAFDAQADSAARSLQSYGLDPTAVASRLDASVRTQRAAAEAGAGTQSDINTNLVGQQLLGQAIQTGQQDAGITQGMASTAAANRNQAVNTGLATTASGSATMGTPYQWAGLGGTELQQWPQAELNAMQASNQQGALWNDINKTNLMAQQQANSQGSGWGALLGAGLGVVGSALGGPLGGMAGSMIGKGISSAMSSGSTAPGSGFTFQQGGPVPSGQGNGMDTPGGLPEVAPPPRAAIDTGSIVPPGAAVSGIQGPDKVPAMLGVGEGIVPLPVMQHIGKRGFEQWLQKNYREMGLGPQPVGGKDRPMPRQAMQTGPTFASQGALA